MWWLGFYTFRGLEVVRNRFGEGTYKFILRLTRPRRRSNGESARLVEIGKLVGLNAAETAAAAAASKTAFTFPLWLRIVLACIAVIGTYVIIRQVLYAPGTLYASIKPDDYMINS